MSAEDKNYSDIVENKEIFVLKNDAVEEIYGWKFQPGDTIKIEWFDGTKYREDIFSIGGEITSEKAYSDSECFTALGVSGWFLMPEDLIRTMLPEGYNINSIVWMWSPASGQRFFGRMELWKTPCSSLHLRQMES